MTYYVLIDNAIEKVKKDNLLGENINPNKYINKPITMYYLHNGGYIQSLITGEILPNVEGIDIDELGSNMMKQVAEEYDNFVLKYGKCVEDFGMKLFNIKNTSNITRYFSKYVKNRKEFTKDLTHLRVSYKNAIYPSIYRLCKVFNVSFTAYKKCIKSLFEDTNLG